MEKEEKIHAARYPLEDMAMKTAAQYFGPEFLPYLGITQKLTAAAPTEVIRLEAKQMYQDFNYIDENGGWIHLEFESDSVKTEDLRRFREYEAATSRAYKVPVTTYVLCSSTVRHIRSELKSGLNTYRVHIIRLKDYDADKIMGDIMDKYQSNIPLQKRDLILSVLTPLMSGKTTQRDRFLGCCKLLREEQEKGKQEEKEKLQAVLYALANKFLGKEDLEEIKEVLKMTILGEMIREDGIEEGEERVSRLNLLLISENRYEDLERASKDKEYRRKLFTDFEI